MEYQKMDQTIIVRLDPKDEIYECLFKIAQDEKIELASIVGIGAIDEATIGLFDPVSKEYHKNEFKDKDFEIVSLIGNISQLEEKPYLHLHISIADENGNVYGGHLNKAIVSATAEIFITLIKGKINREFNDNIGLNILKFNSK